MNEEADQPTGEYAQLDLETFEQICDDLFPRLYAYVRSRVPHPQDAEDLVADTFLKATVGLHRFEWRHEGSVAAWIFRIAHNLICTFYQQRQRQVAALSLGAITQVPTSTP
ncbi:MAG: RNA polymerase sigma factor, partial [Chloroflexales bacterium]|nr:RNA polymerase sigma factor [Chloroflexales bacterium]